MSLKNMASAMIGKKNDFKINEDSQSRNDA